MANIRGPLRPITDLAIVCTEKQFADLCALDNKYSSIEYVYLLNSQIRGSCVEALFLVSCLKRVWL